MSELPIELFHLLVPIGCGGERDAPIRMQVVDMAKGEKSVQRCVNRSGYRIFAKRAKRVKPDHFVLKLHAAIAALERVELAQIQGSESASLNAADIAAATFDPEDVLVCAVQWILADDFRAGISATKISDSQIRTQEIGAVAEQIGAVELLRGPIVPAILQVPKRF